MSNAMKSFRATTCVSMGAVLVTETVAHCLLLSLKQHSPSRQEVSVMMALYAGCEIEASEFRIGETFASFACSPSCPAMGLSNYFHPDETHLGVSRHLKFVRRRVYLLGFRLCFLLLAAEQRDHAMGS